MGRRPISDSGVPTVALAIRIDPKLLDGIDEAAQRRAAEGRKGATRQDWIRLALARVLATEPRA